MLAVYFNCIFIKTFGSDEKSKIINHKALNKKTIEEILDDIFYTDVDENEQEMENFRKEYDL